MDAREPGARRWWHGSAVAISEFRIMKGAGGIHFGTMDQAMARRRSFLHEVELKIEAPCRSRDNQDWCAAARRARSRNMDAIVYLNRYEGLSLERILELQGAGKLSGLDGLPDAAFRKLVPEARDSVCVLRPDIIRLMRILDRDGAVVWERQDPRRPEGQLQGDPEP